MVNGSTGPKLLGEARAEFSLVEQSNRAMWALLLRNPAVELKQVADRLQTEPIAEAVTKIEQELNRDIPDATTVVREAKHLKELVKQWRKGVQQAGGNFCL